MHYFLGVEVLPSADGIILCQTKYVQDLLSECGMLECNGVSTPMSSSATFQIDPTSPPTDIELYRRIVGRLQYLAFTRPDLSYAVKKLAQFMHSPQLNHWQAIKRLLRYL